MTDRSIRKAESAFGAAVRKRSLVPYRAGSNPLGWYQAAADLARASGEGEVAKQEHGRALQALSDEAPGWLVRSMGGAAPAGIPEGRAAPSVLEILGAGTVPAARPWMRRLELVLRVVGGPGLPAPLDILAMEWLVEVPRSPEWPGAAPELLADLVTKAKGLVISSPDASVDAATLDGLAALLDGGKVKSVLVVAGRAWPESFKEAVGQRNSVLGGRFAPEIELLELEQDPEDEPGLRSGLDLQTGDVEELFGRACALLSSDLNEEAVDILRAVVKRAPNHARAWYALGLGLAEAVDVEVALECYREATRSAASLAPAWLERAQAEDVLGRTAEAKVSYQKYLALGSDGDGDEERERIRTRLVEIDREPPRPRPGTRAAPPPSRTTAAGPRPPTPAAVPTASSPGGTGASPSGREPGTDPGTKVSVPAPPPPGPAAPPGGAGRELAPGVPPAAKGPSMEDLARAALAKIGKVDLPGFEDEEPKDATLDLDAPGAVPRVPGAPVEVDPLEVFGPRAGRAERAGEAKAPEPAPLPGGARDPRVRRAALAGTLALVGLVATPHLAEWIRGLLTEIDDLATLVGVAPTDPALGPVARCLLAADAALLHGGNRGAEPDQTRLRLARAALGRLAETDRGPEAEARATRLARLVEDPDSPHGALLALGLGVEALAGSHPGLAPWEARFKVGHAFRRLFPRIPPFAFAPEERLEVPPALVAAPADDPLAPLLGLGPSYWKSSLYLPLAAGEGPLPAAAARTLFRLVGRVPASLVDRSQGSKPVEELLPRLGEAVLPGALAAILDGASGPEQRGRAALFGGLAAAWPETSRVAYYRLLLRSGWNEAVPPLPRGQAWADALAHEFAASPYGPPR